MRQSVPQPDKVSFSVSDFGPVARADFDLRPLTVLYGPSSAGKSYLATLVYALHKCFGKLVAGHPFLGFGDFREFRWASAWDSLASKEKRAFKAWLEEHINHRPGNGSPPPCPALVERALRRTMSDLEGIRQGLESSMRRYFAVGDLRELVRDRRNGHAEITAGMPPTSHGAAIKIELGSETKVKTEFPPTANLVPAVWLPDALPSGLLAKAAGEDAERLPVLCYSALVSLLVRQSFSPLTRRAHYLPSGRKVTMDSHRLMIGALVAEAAYNGSGNGESRSRMSGTVSDFVDGIIRSGDKRGSYGEIATAIEEGILAGTIHEERTMSSEIPEFFFVPSRRNTRRRIPLVCASAMISELAPLVLHLRHAAREGDLLVIEEPEAHVYPGLQVMLAAQLSRLVRSGLRAILVS